MSCQSFFEHLLTHLCVGGLRDRISNFIIIFFQLMVFAVDFARNLLRFTVSMEQENKQLQTGWLAYDDVGLSII